MLISVCLINLKYYTFKVLTKYLNVFVDEWSLNHKQKAIYMKHYPKPTKRVPGRFYALNVYEYLQTLVNQ